MLSFTLPFFFLNSSVDDFEDKILFAVGLGIPCHFAKADLDRLDF